MYSGSWAATTSVSVLSFSDVVLCMEAWKAGYRVVYTPHARLVHHESYTRRREDSAEDMELLARYLRATDFVEDPYFHPELDAKSPRAGRASSVRSDAASGHRATTSNACSRGECRRITAELD